MKDGPANSNHGPTSSADNVVAFPVAKQDNEDEIVLVCRGCGCMSFYLHEDTMVQCTACDGFIDCAATEWRKRLRPVPDDVELEDTKGLVVKQVLGDKVLARARVLKTINDAAKVDELALVMSYNENGAGQHWSNIETAEQRDWTIGRVEDFLEWLRNMKFEEDGE